MTGNRPASPTTAPLYQLCLMGIGVWTTRFLLRTAGFHRTVSCLGQLPRLCTPRDEPDPAWPRQIGYVDGRPFGATCLDRSVFLWFVLHQHRIEGDLKIGVATNDAGIDGHAWVEHHGRVLNDSEDIANDFAVFDEDPVGIVFR